MPPRQRQPTAERRRQIARAALEILAEHGPRRLTAAEIARRVGIADGTIFRHFRDKAEILAAAVGRIEEVLFEDFPPEDPDPLGRLGRFFVRRLELMQAHPEVLRVAMGEHLLGAAGEEAAAQLRRVQDRAGSFVHGCLQEAQGEGSVGRDLSPEALTATVLGALRLAASGGLGSLRLEEPQALWTTLEALLRRSADRPPSPSGGAFPA